MKNQGDTGYIELAYTINGEPITEGQFDEIEFYLGKSRYLLSEGDIVWDEDLGSYCVFINQDDTLRLKSPMSYQLRLRHGRDVISTNIERRAIGLSISKEII